ncbi:MAG: chorismate synthase [Dictyoglomus sp.]|nr:chorismate synthase [Dictyoglomus sp.]MCX7941749.1 chorismate synthase [Dictyoglomaceae bacterium]MDW8189042.1 chorismate synthase [Dictyoglomus sp.]
MRFLTAGESHGPCLTAIIEGFPAGVKVSIDEINKELEKRQRVYGRGERMKIEKDEVEILSGVRGGYTLGSPITLRIKNRDWENWKEIMNILEEPHINPITIPRPGHADLPGVLKYHFDDIRNVLERASARETAIRVAVGAFAKIFLKEFNIELLSYTESIGEIEDKFDNLSWDELKERVENSDLRWINFESENKVKNLIDKAKEEGDTLGGTFIVLIRNVPPGLGSYVHWDKRLDGLLAQAILSIPSVKGVEIGEAFLISKKRGSEVLDSFVEERGIIKRKTNYMGGIEGGVSNGENIKIRGAVKPIPTLRKPLLSFDLKEHKLKESFYERSDVCVVPAVCIIGEAMVSWVIASEFLKKFSGDHLSEIKRSYEEYRKYLYKRIWKKLE